MKKIISSLQWLKDANTTTHPDTEQLRQHANSIESMVQAWLNAPVKLMSTGQQLVAALNIIERLCPDRCSNATRLEEALRRCQHAIQQQYAECRLEHDADQYDIEDRAAFFGEVKKPCHPNLYAEVMIANARAATGDETINSYLAAAEALATIEAKSMAEACESDPLVLADDTAFFKEKTNETAAETPSKEERADEKPKRNRKQKAEETTEANKKE